MKRAKESKGITLIALVITILVLLILAGVTIQTLSGSNGIVSKARKANNANMYMAILERLNLELNNLLIPTAGNDYNYTGKVTLREYVDALKGQDVNGTILMEEDESTVNAKFIEKGYVNFAIGGYIYKINVEKIENVDESEEDLYSKYYVIGSQYVAKQSEAGPELDVELTSTSNQITATVTYSNIDEKGTFKYYYKLQEEEESKYKLAKTQTGVTENPITYTFEGLEQDKTYEIKIEATNSNKKTTIAIALKSTGKVAVAEGNIEFGEVAWNATTHTASVPINKIEEVAESSQYQIGGTTGEWKNGDEAVGIKTGETVYARLWDGTNGGETISTEVTDLIEPQKANISLSTTSATSGAKFTATVTHIDNESGVDITKCKYVLNTSNSEKIDESSYTGNFSSNGQPLSLSASTNGTYYLHVLTADYENNVTQTISSPVTISNPTYTWAVYNAVGTVTYSSKSLGIQKVYLSHALGCHPVLFNNINQKYGLFVGQGDSNTFSSWNLGCFGRNYCLGVWYYDRADRYEYLSGVCATESGSDAYVFYMFPFVAKTPLKDNKFSNNTSSTSLGWNVELFEVASSTSYSKGTSFIGNVTNTNPNAYPANGYQSGAWYIKQ